MKDVTDPMNHVTTYGYDDSGDLVDYHDPALAETRYAYGSDHLLSSVTEVNPQVGFQPTTAYTYSDAYGTIDTIQEPTEYGGPTLTSSYNYGSGPTMTGPMTLVVTDAHGNKKEAIFSDGEMTALTKGYEKRRPEVRQRKCPIRRTRWD